uniref:Uncharacterized protein n=1 Tax=Mesocestoides corti TaxID=53468 RepID=A0A5K3G139_MESCO
MNETGGAEAACEQGRASRRSHVVDRDAGKRRSVWQRPRSSTSSCLLLRSINSNTKETMAVFSSPKRASNLLKESLDPFQVGDTDPRCRAV